MWMIAGDRSLHTPPWPLAMDGGHWEDFGQKVDLTARIREILINYPEGTSILKELIQVKNTA